MQCSLCVCTNNIIENEALKVEVLRLKEQLKALEKEKAAAKVKFEQYTSELDEIRQQLRSAVSQNNQLISEGAKAKVENINLKSAIERLKVEVEQYKEKVTHKGHLLRGARARLTIDRKNRAESKSKYSLVQTFNEGENGQNTRTVQFMSSVRFIKHAALLSDQKLCLVLDFFNQNPLPHFVISPSTIADWNLLLGEVDKIMLTELLSKTKYEIHLWGDDSHKNNEERHVFGVHTWHPQKHHPVRYVLGNLLTASGSGKDQAAVEFHTANKIFGITNVGAAVGDNASTQSGRKKGVVAMASANFNKEMFFVGCYAHVMNILLKRVAYAGFGSKGDMSAFNIMQLHFKVSF